jgi:hypothetical protein
MLSNPSLFCSFLLLLALQANVLFGQSGLLKDEAVQDTIKPGANEDLAAEAFLTQKSGEQAQKNEKMKRVRGQDFEGQIVGLIRATSMVLPNAEFTQNQSIKTRIADAFVVDVAQYLLALGFSTGQVRSDKSGAILSSAAEAVRGTASVNAYTILSDSVAVAELVSVDPANLGDGFYSTANFRVTDPVKGAASGQTLSDGSSQIVSLDLTGKQVGQTFLVFLSKGLYQTSVGKTNASFYLPAMDHAPIVGGRVLAIPGGDVGDLATVSAALKAEAARSK